MACTSWPSMRSVKLRLVLRCTASCAAENSSQPEPRDLCMCSATSSARAASSKRAHASGSTTRGTLRTASDALARCALRRSAGTWSCGTSAASSARALAAAPPLLSARLGRTGDTSSPGLRFSSARACSRAVAAAAALRGAARPGDGLSPAALPADLGGVQGVVRAAASCARASVPGVRENADLASVGGVAGATACRPGVVVGGDAGDAIASCRAVCSGLPSSLRPGALPVGVLCTLEMAVAVGRTRGAGLVSLLLPTTAVGEVRSGENSCSTDAGEVPVWREPDMRAVLAGDPARIAGVATASMPGEAAVAGRGSPAPTCAAGCRRTVGGDARAALTGVLGLAWPGGRSGDGPALGCAQGLACSISWLSSGSSGPAGLGSGGNAGDACHMLAPARGAGARSLPAPASGAPLGPLQLAPACAAPLWLLLLLLHRPLGVGVNESSPTRLSLASTPVDGIRACCAAATARARRMICGVACEAGVSALLPWPAGGVSSGHTGEPCTRFLLPASPAPGIC